MYMTAGLNGSNIGQGFGKLCYKVGNGSTSFDFKQLPVLECHDAAAFPSFECPDLEPLPDLEYCNVERLPVVKCSRA